MSRTTFPTLSDVQALLSSTPSLAKVWDVVNPGEAQIHLDAVIAETLNRTNRQFVADAQDTVRTYDGSDTPELEIDAMVSLTKVSVVGIASSPGYDLANVTLAQAEIGKPRTRLLAATGGVPAWAPAAVMAPTYAVFPAGRANIIVTGRFGYAQQVPADLWSAVRGEAAIRLVRQGLFVPDGRLVEEKFGDESRKYSLPDADVLLWHTEFEVAIKNYKKPQGKKMRNLRGRMID